MRFGMRRFFSVVCYLASLITWAMLLSSSSYGRAPDLPAQRWLAPPQESTEVDVQAEWLRGVRRAIRMKDRLGPSNAPPLTDEQLRQMERMFAAWREMTGNWEFDSLADAAPDLLDSALADPQMRSTAQQMLSRYLRDRRPPTPWKRGAGDNEVPDMPAESVDLLKKLSKDEQLRAFAEQLVRQSELADQEVGRQAGVPRRSGPARSGGTENAANAKQLEDPLAQPTGAAPSNTRKNTRPDVDPNIRDTPDSKSRRPPSTSSPSIPPRQRDPASAETAATAGRAGADQVNLDKEQTTAGEPSDARPLDARAEQEVPTTPGRESGLPMPGRQVPPQRGQTEGDSQNRLEPPLPAGVRRGKRHQSPARVPGQEREFDPSRAARLSVDRERREPSNIARQLERHGFAATLSRMVDRVLDEERQRIENTGTESGVHPSASGSASSDSPRERSSEVGRAPTRGTRGNRTSDAVSRERRAEPVRGRSSRGDSESVTPHTHAGTNGAERSHWGQIWGDTLQKTWDALAALPQETQAPPARLDVASTAHASSSESPERTRGRPGAIAMACFVVFVLALLLFFRRWRARHTEGTAPAELQWIRRLVDRGVFTRAELVSAFHRLALQGPDRALEWWTHRRTAQQWCERSPQTAPAMLALADAYEFARYCPPHAEFTADQLRQIRLALDACRRRDAKDQDSDLPSN